jgi:hypothetical protein
MAAARSNVAACSARQRARSGRRSCLAWFASARACSRNFAARLADDVWLAMVCDRPWRHGQGKSRLAYFADTVRTQQKNGLAGRGGDFSFLVCLQVVGEAGLEPAKA